MDLPKRVLVLLEELENRETQFLLATRNKTGHPLALWSSNINLDDALGQARKNIRYLCAEAGPFYGNAPLRHPPELDPDGPPTTDPELLTSLEIRAEILQLQSPMVISGTHQGTDFLSYEGDLVEVTGLLIWAMHCAHDKEREHLRPQAIDPKNLGKAEAAIIRGSHRQ